MRNSVNTKKMEYNQAIKDRPQRAVGWTRKETRALYSGVMALNDMKSEYRASTAYITIFSIVIFWLLVLIFYLIAKLNMGGEPLLIVGFLSIILIYMLAIIYKLVRHPHIRISNNALAGPPGIIFKERKIDLTEPFDVIENRGNLLVMQNGQIVSVIYRVLPKECHEQLRCFILNHACATEP